MSIIADTSGILAWMNAKESTHAAVRAIVEAHRDEIVVPDLVIAEVDYLALHHLGLAAEESFLEDIAHGSLTREPLEAGDLERGLEIVRRYRDADVGIVDATMVALAERLRVTRVLTLDERHFRAFRLKNGKAFTLLPADGAP